MADVKTAQDNVAKWREASGVWRDRIVMIAGSERDGRLHIGTSVALPREIRERIADAAGVPVEFMKVRVRFHQAGDAYVRPLVGGTRIESEQTGEQGTLGLVVQSVIGDAGILTAGHFVGGVGDTVGQPDLDNIVGTVVANNFITPGGVDGAFIVLSTNDYALGSVWQEGGGTTRLTDMLAVPVEGSACTMQGADSGNVNGLVLWTGVQIDNVTNLSVATYPAQEGDSGAPVYSGTTFLGVHSLGVDVGGGVMYSGFTQVSGLQRVVNFNLG
ncbi:MAG TPA: hypothetical protein VFN10_21055 [Thermoanaerobaculia bacterium]|nr:hypothetical protein [Thermoanaerobaculia bacterium]